MKKTTLAEEIRQQVASLTASRSELLDQRATLVDEQNAVLDAPLSSADIKAFVGQYIDAQAAEYPRRSNMAGMFSSLAYPRGDSRLEPSKGDGRHRGAPPFALRDADRVFSDPDLVSGSTAIFGKVLDLVMDSEGLMRNSDYGLCFFFGDIIKAKLAEQFDARFTGYKPADQERIGPPIAARRERLAVIAKAIAALDEQIANVTAQISELRAAATPTGEAKAPADLGTRVATAEPDMHPRKPYYEGEVLSMTSFNLKQLREAQNDGGFPMPTFREGSDVPFYDAATVDKWMRMNMPKKAFA